MSDMDWRDIWKELVKRGGYRQVMLMAIEAIVDGDDDQQEAIDSMLTIGEGFDRITALYEKLERQHRELLSLVRKGSKTTRRAVETAEKLALRISELEDKDGTS